MSVARVRCSACRNYVPREEIYYETRVSRICSEDCFRSLHERNRTKARSRKREKAKKKPESRLDIELRRKVRKRDGNVCRWCGKNGEQVHHIKYRSQGGPDHLGNLILLCQEHHQRVHSNKKHWQPTLLALLWIGYVNGRWMTVPETERYLIRKGLLGAAA